MRVYKPAAFAALISVSVKTLQRWDNCGKFIAKRTPTNKRYYTDDDLERYFNGEVDDKA